MGIADWVRPVIGAMKGYTPGEQPGPGARVVKLNTNENPYAAPPPVLEAIADAATGERLRRYPAPEATPVREAAGRAYELDPQRVVVGNGSDELLTMALRTFIDPGGVVAAPGPTYSLYPTLSQIQGATYREVPWRPEGGVPVQSLLEQRPSLMFVARPNSPSGHACPLDEVALLCRSLSGVVVLDEAYVDFADDDGLGLLADHDNLLITRSFSKGWSLAGLRVGLGFTSPELAAELHKVRDSYNLDALAQAGAAAALDHRGTYTPLIDAIRAERTRLGEALTHRGWRVAPSQANFLFARVPAGTDAAAVYQGLKDNGVLVRHFPEPAELADGLRITVGSPEENDTLLATLDRL
jgi:histidinol-phosphate aminotransferase